MFSNYDDFSGAILIHYFWTTYAFSRSTIVCQAFSLSLITAFPFSQIICFTSSYSTVYLHNKLLLCGWEVCSMGFCPFDLTVQHCTILTWLDRRPTVHGTGQPSLMNHVGCVLLISADSDAFGYVLMSWVWSSVQILLWHILYSIKALFQTVYTISSSSVIFYIVYYGLNSIGRCGVTLTS